MVMPQEWDKEMCFPRKNHDCECRSVCLIFLCMWLEAVFVILRLRCMWFWWRHVDGVYISVSLKPWVLVFTVTKLTGDHSYRQVVQ